MVPRISPIDFLLKRRDQWSMVFESRQEAGRLLGRRLQDLGLEVDLVAGLPRGGGVVVAVEVANALQCPLDVIFVRKIGHPRHREFAVGALAEHDVLILDQDELGSNPPGAGELDRVIAEERSRLNQYYVKFHPERRTGFAGSRVLLVDDGLATGATAEAAVFSARQKQARQVILAAPVASASACERLERLADRVVTLVTDADFQAVGQYYNHFGPVGDEEVLALLHHHQANYRPAR